MNLIFSNLESNFTLGELLHKKLHFSKNSLKKYLSKKQLERQIKYKDEVVLPINLLNNGLINPDYTGPEIKTIFENEKFIVLNKPEGIHGHCLEYEENDTVLNFLRKNYQLDFLSKRNLENFERGLLYRLDQTTSGVLIFVKNENEHQILRSDFSNVVLSKEYLAIVEGVLEIDKNCTHYLLGSEQKGHKIIQGESGVECQAHYQSLKVIDGRSTLIKVSLKTGFRHQIRAQLSLIGHPIVGDTLYGAQASSRIFLHAFCYRLKFENEVFEFIAADNELFCNFLHTDSLLKVIR